MTDNSYEYARLQNIWIKETKLQMGDRVKVIAEYPYGWGNGSMTGNRLAIGSIVYAGGYSSLFRCLQTPTNPTGLGWGVLVSASDPRDFVRELAGPPCPAWWWVPFYVLIKDTT